MSTDHRPARLGLPPLRNKPEDRKALTGHLNETMMVT